MRENNIFIIELDGGFNIYWQFYTLFLNNAP